MANRRVFHLTLVLALAARAGSPPAPDASAAAVKTGDGQINAIAALPTGVQVLAAGNDLTLVDLAAGQKGKPFSSTARGTRRAILVSADGARFFSATEKGWLEAGAVAAGAVENKTKGHEGSVNTLALSPDGKWLVSGGEDKQLKLWNPATLEAVQTILAMPSVIQSAAFSPDGKTLAAAGDDGAIFLFAAGSWEHKAPVPSGDTINALAYSPDGKWLASAGNSDKLQIWSPATEKLARWLPRQSGWVERIAWSRDGRRLVSLASDRTLRIFNAESGELLEWFDAPNDDDVTALALLPDGSFATGGRDRVVRRWVAKKTGSAGKP